MTYSFPERFVYKNAANEPIAFGSDCKIYIRIRILIKSFIAKINGIVDAARCSIQELHYVFIFIDICW